jgi:hypothetical protein
MNRKITRYTWLIGLLGIVSLVDAGAQAETQQTRQVTVIQDMAPVGLTFGQTLRYTFLPAERRSSNQGFGPWEVTLARVLDADGSVLAEKEAPAVAAGQFQSFDFDRDQINAPGEPGTGRLQARLEVTLLTLWPRTGSEPQQSILETFADAAEVIDNFSGRTTVSFSGGMNKIILDDSSGAEHLNPRTFQIISAGNETVLGIVPGESLFVSALNGANPESRERAEPVSVQVEAYDEDGNVIGESDAVEIAPGEFRTIRFNYRDLRMTGEPYTGRKQARIRMFSLIDRARLSPVAATFETVDDVTGKTNSLQLPMQAAAMNAVTGQSSNTADNGLVTFRNLNSIGLVPGESLVATLFSEFEPGQAGKPTIGRPVIFTYTISNASGDTILQRDLEISANELRSIRVAYDELAMAGEAGTGRKQVGIQLRPQPLSGIGYRAVATLELVDSTGGTRVAVDGMSNTVAFAEIYNSPDDGDGDDWLVGIAPGQSLRFSASNAGGSDAGGERTEPISIEVKVYDKDGNVIGGSDVVEIPPGQFRTVRLAYDDLATLGEPGTGRKEIRTKPLWGFRSRDRLVPVTESLEIVSDGTGRTTVSDGSVRFVNSSAIRSFP